MQWKLGGLAGRPAENEQASQAGHVSKKLGMGDQLGVQPVKIDLALRGAPQQQNAKDKPKIAQTVRDERLLGGIRRRRAFVPEANEQVAANAHQFPEDEHHHEVVRQHDAKHGKGEQAQAGKVARHAGIVLHVAVGIEVNGRAHPGDHQQHQQAHRVQQQGDLNLQAIHSGNVQPVETSGGGRSGFRRSHEEEQPTADEKGQADGRDRNEAAEPGIAPREQGDDERREERQQQDNPGQVFGSFEFGVHHCFRAVKSSTWAEGRLR